MVFICVVDRTISILREKISADRPRFFVTSNKIASLKNIPMTSNEQRWRDGGGTLLPSDRSTTSPDDAWIIGAIESTVRISMAWTRGFSVRSRSRQLPVTRWHSDSLRTLPQTIRPPSSTRDPLHEQILSIFMNGNFRRGPLSALIPHLDIFRREIAASIQEQRAIRIVLPTLPFKSQNPLAFPRESSTIDLGEWLHLAQVRDLCASIEAVYTPGLHVTLLTDGLVYAELFGTGNDEACIYRERVTEIKETMGLSENIDVIDMQWLVDREPEFLRVQQHIRRTIARLERTNPDICERMSALRRSMLLHIRVPEYDFDSFVHIVNNAASGLPRTIERSARNTAAGYASFLLAMRWLHITDRAFPNTIRATVHPKPAPQLPLHLVNRHSNCFPYNGVALVSRESLAERKNVRRATRIVRFTDALLMPNLTEVRNENDAFVCLLA